MEYLEDGLKEEYHEVALKPMVHKSKKYKRTNLVDKKPKDRRKGSTIYRVAETSASSHMAPKASAQARATKEAWLKGRSGKSVGPIRKSLSNGFLKSKK